MKAKSKNSRKNEASETSSSGDTIIRGRIIERIVAEGDLLTSVRRGLPVEIFGQFLAQGLTTQELYEIVIPARTLKHRKARHEPLNVDESDRALRTARILAAAEHTFGNLQKALSWLRKPKRQFEGEAPMQLLRTEVGGRLVEEALTQIDEGMFA